MLLGHCAAHFWAQTKDVENAHDSRQHQAAGPSAD